MTKRHLPAVFVLLAALSAITGCNSGRNPTSPEMSTGAAATVNSTSSPEPTAPQASRPPEVKQTTDKPGADSAREAVLGYSAMVDDLSQDPSKDMSILSWVARGRALEQMQQNLWDDRQKGLRQVGNAVTTVGEITYLGANVSSVGACVDVSSTDMLDRKGKSVVAPSRPDRIAYDYMVEKASDLRFYVIDEKVTATAC